MMGWKNAELSWLGNDHKRRTHSKSSKWGNIDVPFKHTLRCRRIYHRFMLSPYWQFAHLRN